MDFFAPREASTQPAARVVPWAEKYRPKSLDDVAAQEQIILTLKKTLSASNLPHMLFYGPPGTGKTSTILALARDLFGPELSKSRVLELNASDDRGIAAVRTKVKTFAQGVVSGPTTEQSSKYPCPNFKIIVLDEADSMTQDAQAALRRIMETNSKYTRFCLVCNYVTRIIDPVASRCTKFRFQPLNNDNALARLKLICESENVNAQNKALEKLLAASNGDLRRAITLLQSSKGLVSDDSPLTEHLVDEISGTVPDSVLNKLVDAILDTSLPINKLQAIVKDVVYEGWSGGQVVDQAHDRFIQSTSLNDAKKAKISLKFSEIDRSLVDGSDEHIVLLDMAFKVGEIVRG